LRTTVFVGVPVAGVAAGVAALWAGRCFLGLAASDCADLQSDFVPGAD
jgi:hypothetical protein